MSAHAQQGTLPKRVGILDPNAPDDPPRPEQYAALEGALARLGWIKDRNVIYDGVWLGGDLSRAPAAARDLISRRPDLIFVVGGGPTTALAGMTRTIPIVF